MDEQFYRERLKTVRYLAQMADPFTRIRLLDLAFHYEGCVIAKSKGQEPKERLPSSPRLPPNPWHESQGHGF
jgi:hypothetical protein